ncbi:hypothetical protein MED121_01975 [Marinomonas sp. MED121]|uniref:uracil-DNA glycosylase family protein n=1 Tax=Marinomonas sp. MED121 TaxID=314277 RepID=UPI0000690B22|nr:uracil-DNA glycosylase family protein [Marinomonas sp. MED121]EAQ65940.1 hypothetical protein MED121_01975 [Marinomonas sp. MED121]
MAELIRLIEDIKACKLCEAHLEHGVRPVVQLNKTAKILIAGQAPGRKVHTSGIPFDDASGDRLRAWMGIDKDTFYDDSKIAILPMGFCYPGSYKGKGKSGDLPPRPECANTWHQNVLALLTQVELVLVIGQYAQDYYLDNNVTVTACVAEWEKHWPHYLPLPHPSPRNNIWLAKNTWFEADILPVLQSRVATLLTS